jgi:hypothetical protein
MNNFYWSNCYVYFIETWIDDNNNFISFVTNLDVIKSQILKETQIG